MREPILDDELINFYMQTIIYQSIRATETRAGKGMHALVEMIS